ncbi:MULTISPECIES: TlpA family protein disulfide reductase [unclassified Psychrobacillus]|uniref:TlpA family protein disulfide reductase n=1 Tax=unclassified Psychrobacillus TaxID=2636677 RepID=UPI0030FB2996
MKNKRQLNALILGIAMSSLVLFGCEQKANQIDYTMQSIDKNESTSTNTQPLETAGGLGIDYAEIYGEKEVEDAMKGVIDQPFKDFTLEDSNGRDVSLKDFVGKRIVIEFASTICPYCIEVQDTIEQFAKNNPDAVLLQVYDRESKDTVLEHLSTIEETPGVIPLIGKGDYAISDVYGAIYTPTFYYIDTEGIVRLMTIGAEGLENYQSHFDQVKSLDNK